MAFLPKLGLALQGFGAGVAGKGQEFIENLDDDRKQAMLEDALTVQQQLQTGDVSGARSVLLNRLQAIDKLGGNPADTEALLLKLDNGDIAGAFNDVSGAVNAGVLTGRLAPPGGGRGVPSQVESFQFLSEGLSPDDELKARRISLGLDPRSVGSAEQTITAGGTVGKIAKTREELAQSAEIGKLKAQFKLKPKIEGAVRDAVSASTSLADQAITDKKNTTTFAVYETGMSGLVSALDNTLTGPFINTIPALTANSQIADGAVAAMAPVMKQMFRAAGEGIFTDKDQELLLEMIPNRDDFPAARAAKLQNIDAIVRAKLGISSQPQNTSLPAGFDQLSPEEQQELRQRLGIR